LVGAAGQEPELVVESVRDLLPQLLVQAVDEAPGLVQTQAGDQALQPEVVLFVHHHRKRLAAR
jgi:hypothetical protein